MTATTFTPANLQANTPVTQTKGAGGSTGASGKGAPGDAADTTVESADSSFNALFQKLMNKTLSPGTDAGLLDSSADSTEKVGAGETAEELDALLPFLEAMGLTQPLAPETAAITPAVTAPPAITAGMEAPQAGNGSLLPMLPTDSGTSSAENIGIIGSTPAGNGDPSIRDVGEDFAAQLTTALDGSQQASLPEGNTTHIVQQVVTTTSASNAPTTMTISQPVGEAGWDQEVGQRIVWMANRAEGKAELVLTPPQMGRIEISLTVSGDQATASFASANPVVREALESALPRLREVLADAGIQLGQAQVGAENANPSAQQEKNTDKFVAQAETSAEKSSIMASSDHDSATAVLKVGRGLVDVFA